MLYLATASTQPVRRAMLAGDLGLMAQPASHGPAAAPGVPWAADNGWFSAKWDEGRWMAWLQSQRPYLASCLFAVVPDVVADASATRERFHRWAQPLADLSYRLASRLPDGPRDLPRPHCALRRAGGLAPQAEIRAGPGEQQTHGRTDVGDPAREEERRAGARHVGRAHTRDAEEVAGVIERHHDHDGAADDVNRFEAFQYATSSRAARSIWASLGR